MKLTSLRIATRKSPLALWQAEYVKHKLQTAFPEIEIELLGMLTTADKLVATPLNKIGGKGLFIKELEKAILENQADLAVHSIKDMPADLPNGLTLAAICKRDDPRDAFVSNQYDDLYSLPKAAVIGTSSLRRQSQVLALRPDLKVQFLRGNVNTRLAKLDSGEFDAIILAAAGLKRLQLEHRIRSYLSEEEVLPAAGQGAIGVETRNNQKDILELLSHIDDEPTRICIIAERAVTQRLGGSCQVPIAAYARIVGDELLLKGLVGRPDGSVIIKAEQTGAIHHPSLLGQQLADTLIEQGALDIINSVLPNESS